MASTKKFEIDVGYEKLCQRLKKFRVGKIFSKNNLSILPITREDYVIANFDAYHKFEPTENKIETVTFPSYLQTLDFNNIFSESIALNCAFASGIIADFMEDEKILPTATGRMSTGAFN